jgi:hypothetical protein
VIRARYIPALLALCLVACKGPLDKDTPTVQDSAPGQPRAIVSFNRVLSGSYRAIAPACIGQQYRISTGGVDFAGGLPMRPGGIIEFRNYQPDVPTNVTALAAPKGLFSPNLVRPYNMGDEGGEAYSFWRYAFPEPGVYEYFDTNMGEPGRKVVDSYYGTVSYVGESTAPRAVVCVDAPGCVASPECLNGTAPAGTTCCSCIGVCCTTDAECTGDKTCLRGRCVSRETGE